MITHINNWEKLKGSKFIIHAPKGYNKISIECMKAERFKKDWPVEMVYTGNTFLPEYKWLANKVYLSTFEVKSFVPVNESRLYFNLYLFLNKTNQTRPPNNDVKNENRFIIGGSSFEKRTGHWRELELNKWMKILRSVHSVCNMEWVTTGLLDDCWLETPYKFMELVGDEFIYHVKDEQMNWLLDGEVLG